MSQNLMEKQWQMFEKMVLPENCDAIQRQEMRRAFYAGASALFSGVLAALSGGDEATPADMQIVEDLHNELRQFGQAVVEGRA
jgi:hypothetical protein